MRKMLKTQSKLQLEGRAGRGLVGFSSFLVGDGQSENVPGIYLGEEMHKNQATCTGCRRLSQNYTTN